MRWFTPTTAAKLLKLKRSTSIYAPTYRKKYLWRKKGGKWMVSLSTKPTTQAGKPVAHSSPALVAETDDTTTIRIPTADLTEWATREMLRIIRS